MTARITLSPAITLPAIIIGVLACNDGQVDDTAIPDDTFRPDSTADDSSADDTGSAYTGAPCEWPADPARLPGGGVSGTIEAGGLPHFYSVSSAADNVLFAIVNATDREIGAEGDGLIMRICTEDGQTMAWAQGDPYYLYRNIGRTRASALLRQSGTYGIQIEAPDDQAWSYELETLSGTNSERATSFEDPWTSEENPGELHFHVTTLPDPGQASWTRFSTDCESCSLALIGQMVTPGSPMTAQLTFHDAAGNALGTLTDSPQDPEVWAQASGAISAAAPVTVKIADADGGGSPDHWFVYYTLVYTP
ncbi:MAG: hypothetical protein H6739_27750 [Alphaproteobacteria bacterium]|nr:hypothetical protein [Alphaproteobacteria bacterium]